MVQSSKEFLEHPFPNPNALYICKGIIVEWLLIKKIETRWVSAYRTPSWCYSKLCFKIIWYANGKNINQDR